MVSNITYQNHDDREPFETVLERIRDKDLRNAQVTFSLDGDRLHYKLTAEVRIEIVTDALGLK